MSEEIIYDDGYHDGVKDVVNMFLLMHMNGSTLVEIRERIVQMRKRAKIQLDYAKDQEHYLDDDED